MQTLIVVCLLKVNRHPRYHPNDRLRRNARLSELGVCDPPSLSHHLPPPLPTPG